MTVSPLVSSALRAVPPLPAGVWRADALARAQGGTVPSGHAPLDAELPDGGWPLGALVELLTATPGTPIWPLLLPALAARQRAGGGVLALVQPPCPPFTPALAAAGVRTAGVLWLAAEAPASRLWAAEQALRCADVTALLAWLPQARAGDLRRLHLAAAQRGDVLCFVQRPATQAHAASPAPLRLRLETARGAAPAPLAVDIVKRRGPSLARPLMLPSQPPALRALLAAHAPGQVSAALHGPIGERAQEAAA